MTYRFVPQKWLRFIQVSTLLLTAVFGLGVVALPRTAAQLSKLEETMSGDWFGWTLFAAGLVGGIAELVMWIRHHERFTGLVAAAHICCVGLLVGYFVPACIGVAMTNWRTFISPALILLLIIWHAGFVQRRPRPPVVPRVDGGRSDRLRELGDRTDDVS